MRYIIYGLRDPRTGELRYIGKSTTGLTRPKKHLLAVRLEDGTHLSNWRKSLHRIGLLDQIEITVLEETTGSELGDREIWWIAQAKIAGADLVNGTDGGEGMLGRKGWRHSEESKERMRLARLGKKASEETRAKMREAHKGKKMPETLKEKLLSIHTGRKHSAETIERMKIAHSEISEETRRKLSESLKGKTLSEETRAKMSEAHIGYKHTPETIEKIRIARREREAQKQKGPTEVDPNC